METRDVLEQEIQATLSKLSETEAVSEEGKALLDKANVLYKLKNEGDKNMIQEEEIYQKIESQAKESKKDRIWKAGTEVGKTVAQCAFLTTMLGCIMKFEESGQAFVSQAAKIVFGHFRLK